MSDITPERENRGGAAETAASRPAHTGFTPSALAGLAPALVFGLLSVAAVWPIYRTPRVWLVFGVALAIAVLLWAVRIALRWSGTRVFLLWLGLFVLSVVPVATPRLVGGNPARILSAERDALAAVVTGWKQLLTLSLPVGDYQAMLVPFYLLLSLSMLISVLLVTGRRRFLQWAVAPLVAPLLFGLIWGPGQVSAPLSVPLVGWTLVAPIELMIWSAALLAALIWVRWGADADRRAALKRGRGLSMGTGVTIQTRAAEGDVTPAVPRRSRWGRRVIGGVLLVAALIGSAIGAPSLAALGQREVPRAYVDPNLIIQAEPSPLGSYRQWKRDTTFNEGLFRVSAPGKGPERLGLAVLDGYDGTDFHVASPTEQGTRFTRFPGAVGAGDTQRVRVEIERGYTQLWLPLPAQIAQPPRFSGARADVLEDSFYLNRDTGTGVVTPPADPLDRTGNVGVRAGDAYEVEFPANPVDTGAPADPATQPPRFPTREMPELTAWLRTQAQPQNAAGFETLVKRLRDRGYLSHGLADDQANSAWITQLREGGGYQFSPSSAGHSGARIEQMFEDLNRQQRAAGPEADERALIAAVGDDEQFAAAVAIIADTFGYDARVVVGVRLGADNDIPGVPACRDTCTGANLAAWVEVRGANDVWHAVDVTPQSANLPTDLVEGQQLPEYATRPQDLGARSDDPQLNVGEGESVDNPDQDEAAWVEILWTVLRIVGLSLGALILLALPILYLPVAKRLRRTRRYAPAPAETRALGAWGELLDGYRDAGRRVPWGVPRMDQAIALAHEGLGDDTGEYGEAERDQERLLCSIASRVDRAVFARGLSTDEDVERIWEDVAVALETLRVSEPGRWRRLRIRWSLRSLLADVSVRGIGAQLSRWGRSASRTLTTPARRLSVRASQKGRGRDSTDTSTHLTQEKTQR
ncbi:transglutaminase domain-containing protein [Mycetocola lacteus]|uniref:Transglutaminase domain-containing protein n=1 Tax=Mycetocola lacteus TaxID=76637 RepID=A0A3L7ARK2_9MICO|nr:transglutaminase domain-containing protein [Mycetocola lacteus]RLP82032.1 transglutaminase domain-containing protein [Mycetocola lacteus]